MFVAQTDLYLLYRECIFCSKKCIFRYSKKNLKLFVKTYHFRLTIIYHICYTFYEIINGECYMNKKRFFKRLSLISLALVMVCSGVIALTGAYFTSSATVSGTIGMGKVAVHFFNGAGTGNSIDNSSTALNKSGLLPGSDVLTALTIKATSSELNTPVYLRLTMFIPTTAYNAMTLTNTSAMPGSGWSQAGTSADTLTISSTSYTRLQWYYGTSATALTSVPAATITSGMSVFTVASNMKIATTQTASLSDFTITLFVDAVQATNIASTVTGFTGVSAIRSSLSL